MTKALQRDIVSLSGRIEQTLQRAEDTPANIPEKARQAAMRDFRIITEDLQQLLDRIDREIPLLQLAITASGESLSTSLPPSISPSRLLQASTLLVVGDIQFSREPTQAVQIGPAFGLSMYMLFQGHAPRAASNGGQAHPSKPGPVEQPASYGLGPTDRKPLWQEVIHKARVRLLRTSSQAGQSITPAQAKAYEYQLDITEDRDDGRVHDEIKGDTQNSHESCLVRRETLPIHEVSKLFYTDTGRILNLGNDEDAENSPVLVLKRDYKPAPSGSHQDLSLPKSQTQATECREQADIDRQILDELCCSSRSVAPGPPALSLLHSASHLDPEWIALEIFEDDDSVASESAESDSASETGDQPEKTLSDQVEELTLHPLPLSAHTKPDVENNTFPESPLGSIVSSLSLLEMLIRLASLQEFQQTSHLAIRDHVLTFFLEETSSTGLVGDSQSKARAETRNKVGFDPYTDRNK